MTISLRITIITTIIAMSLAFFGITMSAQAHYHLDGHASLVATPIDDARVQTADADAGTLGTATLDATPRTLQEPISDPRNQTLTTGPTVQYTPQNTSGPSMTVIYQTASIDPQLLGHVNNDDNDDNDDQDNNNSGSSSGGMIDVRDAETHGVTSITTTSATLHGQYEGFGPVGYRFEYGTTTSMNSDTPRMNGAKGFDINAQAKIYNLEPGTTYYYRIVVDSRGTVKKGAIKSFTTDKDATSYTPMVTYAEPTPPTPSETPTVTPVDPEPTPFIADVDTQRNANTAWAGTAGTGISLIEILISAILLILIMIIGRKIIAGTKKPKLGNLEPEETYYHRY